MFSDFGTDRRGNIAVIFALALLPVMSAVGCAVDYSMAARIKAKLQSAADAASVASIAQNSPGYKAAVIMTSDGAVTDAVGDAYKVFDGNMGSVTGYTNPSRTATVTKTGIQLTSRIEFSADVPVTFLGVLAAFGVPVSQSISVAGSSSSSASLATYLDFYLLLDVSGSMGLPSTTDEAQRLQQLSPDNFVQYPTGCTLACHFSPQNSACVDPGKSNSTQGYPTNGYCLGYAISRVSPSRFQDLLVLQNPQGKYPYKNSTKGSTYYQKYQQLPSSIVSGLPGSLNTDPTYGLPAVSSCPTDGTDDCIQLRLDAVGYAVNELFKTANSLMKVTDQFRIGLYPFITDIDANYAKLTSSINGSSTTPGTINYQAAQLATQLDTNLNDTLGSGGTHIDYALNSLNGLIKTVGNGSSSINRKPFVFLVTDGAQDNQFKDVPNGGWHGSNHATVLNDRVNDYPSICSTMTTDRKIIVAVLYIPYRKIDPVNTSFAGNEDTYANNNIDGIPASLKACASPGFFFTANSPKDITAALNAMFSQSLVTAHITN
jgi:Flp pilus assembly protein TadG